MSEKELNKYRLTSMEEPTDEMLSQIMKEIAVEVKTENAVAHQRLMQELKSMASKETEEAR